MLLYIPTICGAARSETGRFPDCRKDRRRRHVPHMSESVQIGCGEPGLPELDPGLSGVPEVRGNDARVQDHHLGRQDLETDRARCSEAGRSREPPEGILRKASQRGGRGTYRQGLRQASCSDHRNQRLLWLSDLHGVPETRWLRYQRHPAQQV